MARRNDPNFSHIAGATPGVAPTDEEYRAVITDLLQLHDRHEKVHIRKGEKYNIYILHGLVEHAMRVTESALLLVDAGQPAGAAPLARIAFEHALRALWVHQHPDGLEGFAMASDAHQRTVLRESRLLAGIDVSEIEEMLEQYGEAEDGPGAARIFKQTCEAFDSTGWFYAMYRLLSGFVHPGPMTIRHYVRQSDEDDRASIELLAQPAEVGKTMILATLAMAMVFASAVYEDLRHSKPYKSRVKRAAASLGMTALPPLIRS